MLDRFLDFLLETLQAFFVPIICTYYSISGNLFLNTAVHDSQGLEQVGDTLLAPFQYLFCGQSARLMEDGSWFYEQRFDYHDHFWIKTAGSIIALPPSLILGSAAKGVALLSTENRERFYSMSASHDSPAYRPNTKVYEAIGINTSKPTEWISSQGHSRRPEDLKHLENDRKGMKDIISLLDESKIPWWVDCGTCLGAYRYGGVIPWDCDVDIAVLLVDFDNILSALSKLDQKKYLVQDWSGRLNPKSLIKVYMRESNSYIDLYFFSHDLEKKMVQFFLSLETSSLFPEQWKIRERRFTVPVAIETVFPLKRILFDGIEVNIPNDPVKYLQRYYGENLAPAKIYNPVSNQYEKDLTHPYWQREYAH
ncbi:MAG: LicD family protein [Verrucomicrobia bacterium]|nr:LicD family protein [Verrucomicrobiota bacterium]